MCVMSMIGDHYADKWRPRMPEPQPFAPVAIPDFQFIGRAEFDALKREVQEMKELLLRAKRYDEEHGEPDCSMEEKVDILKRMAKAFDVDLSEVFGVPSAS